MSQEEITNKPELLMIAYLCIKDLEGLNKRVEVLDRFGMTNSQIALVCGCAVQSVKNARQQYKKAQSKKTSKKGGK